ncbi:MAG: hypothetical protein M1358_05715 [Chloroflexi bacterium]|nr:hypothetical protein [Chloroflexota bacterium]
MTDKAVSHPTSTGTRKRSIAPGPLRFGIDIDGTISQAPRHFKRLIDALLDRGNEVYIITGRQEDRRRQTQELLDCLEIRYTELVMRPEDWQGTVAEFKVQEVRDRDVHLMIDDDTANCWAVEQQTQALAAHMLPVPEMPEAKAAKARMRRRERKDRRPEC